MDAKDIENGVKQLSEAAQNLKRYFDEPRVSFNVCFDAHIKAFKVTLEIVDPTWLAESGPYVAIVFASPAAMGLTKFGIEAFLWNQFRGLLPEGVLT